jgi:hypothetical protein
MKDLSLGTQQQNIQDAADRDRLARRRVRVHVDRADVRGANKQFCDVRFAILEAIDGGTTDPAMLDLVVAAVLSLGNPDAPSAQAPLIALADLPASARQAHRRHPTQVDAA